MDYSKFSKKAIYKLLKKNKITNYTEVKPYSILAFIYDRVMKYNDYRGWYKYLLILIHEFDLKPIYILELACGSGNFTKYLSKLPASLSALDNSENMLSIAKNKIKNKTQNQITWLKEDLTTYKILTSYDLIISFNDNFNYVNDLQTMRIIFENIFASLNENGSFIFDLSTERNIINNFVSIVDSNMFGDYCYVWINRYDKQKREIVSKFNIFDYNESKLYIENHFQVYYPGDIIFGLLESVGFKEVTLFGDYTLNKPQKKSLSYHFVAIK